MTNRILAAIMLTAAIVVLVPTGALMAQSPSGGGADAPARADSASSAEAPKAKLGEALTLDEVQAWHGRHPRLYFSRTDIEKLQARRASEPWKRAYETMIARADRHMRIDLPDAEKPLEIPPLAITRLGLAALMTGDRRYGRKAADILLALGERGFPFAGRGEVDAANLLIDIAQGYDLAYDHLTMAERSTFNRQLMAFAMRLNMLLEPDGGFYGKLAARPGAAGHHGVAITAGALGLTALVLRGEVTRDATNPWQAAADRCINAYYRDALGSDGAGIEGFDFTTLGLHGALPYTIARRRMDGVDPGEGTALGSMSAWMPYELLPGPETLPINDSGRTLGAEDAMAELFAALPGDPLAAWFYDQTHGAKGRRDFGTRTEDVTAGDVAAFLFYPGEPKPFDPGTKLPLGKQFPSRGLAIVRSGWADPAGDVVVSFHCPSRAHVGRWQMDVNQFTLFAYGQTWAGDSGYAWRASAASMDLTASGGSQGHNLMRIDDAGAVKPYGRMLAFMDEKDWSLAVGDASTAFGVKTFRRYLAVGKRGGRARYVVVIDEIDPGDEKPHQYTHFLQLGAGVKATTTGQIARIETENQAVGQLAVVSPRECDLMVTDFETMASGTHPRIDVSHATRGPFYYVAVLVPRAAKDERPIAVKPEPERDGAIAFTVTVDELVDRVCVLTKPGATPPEGYGRNKHRIQLTNASSEKSLLFDVEEPGHDRPSTPERP